MRDCLFNWDIKGYYFGFSLVISLIIVSECNYEIVRDLKILFTPTED